MEKALQFKQLRSYIDQLSDHFVPSFDIRIMRDHQEVYRYKFGYRDEALTQPLQGNETYCLYSCSKVSTTLAVMQLIENGRLGLDDPVAKYLPAWKELKVNDQGVIRPARTQMTIRHLLSMQSGLDYELTSPQILQENARRNGRATTRQIIDALAEKPLCFDPGSDFLYSLSHDVLAAVVEVASGQRFSNYLSQHIFQPAGMTQTGFTPTDAMQETQCAQWRFITEDQPPVLMGRFDNEYALSPCYESGGAGLISNVHDYSLLADALACGSTIDGHVLLGKETQKLWHTAQLCEKGEATFATWGRKGYSYALGVRTRVQQTPDRKGPVGEFGWDGAAASFLLIDEQNHLSYFFAMHTRNFGYAYDTIHPSIQNLVYDALELDRLTNFT